MHGEFRIKLYLVCCYGQFDQLLWTCHSAVYNMSSVTLLLLLLLL
jgi:hypothetical protein